MQKTLPDNLITPSEWAQITGFSRRFAYYLMDNGHLPWVQVYGFRRIRINNINADKYKVTESQVREHRERNKNGKH